MYQTDLTETEWEYITKVLNLQERKRKYDLSMIWNAIFYLVKTGWIASDVCYLRNFLTCIIHPHYLSYVFVKNSSIHSV